MFAWILGVTFLAILECVFWLRDPSGAELVDARQAKRATFWSNVLLAVPALLVLVVVTASGLFLIGTTHYHGWEGNGDTVAWLFVFGLPTVCFALGTYVAYAHRFGRAGGPVIQGAVVCLLMAGALLFVSPWCYSHCTAEDDAATHAYDQAAILLLGGGLGGLVTALFLFGYDVKRLWQGGEHWHSDDGRLAHFWHDYLDAAHRPPDTRYYGAGHFGNSEAVATECVDLVLRGVKTATSTLLQEHQHTGKPLPQPGDAWIVTTWQGEPVCITETVEVKVMGFREVNERFARDYGEGDRTLLWWREAMWEYYAEECAAKGWQLSEDMPLVCERFRLVFPTP